MTKTNQRFLTAAVVFCCSVAAQNPPATETGTYNSRAEEIQAAREEKQAHPAADEKSTIENVLIYTKQHDLLNKWKYGFHGIKPRIGAMIVGSGFAFGPEYRRPDLAKGKISFRATTQVSTHWYELYETELAFPRLASDRAFVSIDARYRDYSRMMYYGPGPDSKKTGRSDYRLEDTRAGFTAGFAPVSAFSFGVRGNYLTVNIGSGKYPGIISTDQQYTEAQTPGIQQQTDFMQGAVFAAYDTRDNPGGPRTGTLLRGEYLYNKDIRIEQDTHKRLNLEGQQYLSFWNRRRVIALRARSELTYKNPGQVVPFYMQPILGGSEDLRGFRPFRFYDDNSLLFQAEYRYEIFAGLDMALFGDAGKVFHSKDDFNVDNLEGCYGIGMRFNARNSVFMRLDAGISREGFQVWMKFNNVF